MADLHFSEAQPTVAEQAAVDAVVPASDAAVMVETERLVRGGSSRRRSRRHLLLPLLHALQRQAGWISPGGLNAASERLGVPPAEAYGVAGFYELFRTSDPGRYDDVMHVCEDLACAMSGADRLAQQLSDTGAQVRHSPCLGQCERAPAQFVQGVGSPDRVPADTAEPFRLPQAGDVGLRVLRRVGVADPCDLDGYRAHGGYEALTVALRAGSEEVVAAVTEAGLTGRGGAAFPTGIKWRAVLEQPGPTKHVVANCDESEPGTFKDRVLCEQDPFAVVEALTVAGMTTGAEQGWIYLRGEYPLAAERLQGAIEQSTTAGLLGSDVANSGRRFEIQLRRGAGAYICGEETALFNSIEGFRGEPRNKPPFPTTHGLFGQPTAINNPETLCNVLDILRFGPEAYRSVGTEESPGTRLFCVSGRVTRPGLYEAPFGVTLGELLELAGGVTGTLRTVLLGGAAGSFVGPERLDMPLTLQDTRALGTTLGSGAVIVFDDTVNMAQMVVRIAEFFRDESCGQCVPCRVGTQRQHETLVTLQHSGEVPAESQRVLLEDIAQVMGDASICGLGHTAASAVRSALDLGLMGGQR